MRPRGGFRSSAPNPRTDPASELLHFDAAANRSVCACNPCATVIRRLGHVRPRLALTRNADSVSEVGCRRLELLSADCGTARAEPCILPAIASVSVRCSTPKWTAGCCGPPRSRACSLPAWWQRGQTCADSIISSTSSVPRGGAPRQPMRRGLTPRFSGPPQAGPLQPIVSSPTLPL